MVAVLTRRKEFENILGGHGTKLKVPEREFTNLADDLRLTPNYTFSMEQTREIEARMIQRRHFWDSVRMTAASKGVPLHEATISRGMHIRPEKEPIVENHNELYRREQATREADAHHRDEQAMSRVESARLYLEDLPHAPRSMTDQIASAAKHVVGSAGGMAGGFLGGGVGHDVGSFLAGNTAAQAVRTVDAIGSTASTLASGMAKSATRQRMHDQETGTYRAEA